MSLQGRPALEGSPGNGVLFNIADAALVFALCVRPIRRTGPRPKTPMLGKGVQSGIELDFAGRPVVTRDASPRSSSSSTSSVIAPKCRNAPSTPAMSSSARCRRSAAKKAGITFWSARRSLSGAADQPGGGERSRRVHSRLVERPAPAVRRTSSEPAAGAVRKGRPQLRPKPGWSGRSQGVFGLSIDAWIEGLLAISNLKCATVPSAPEARAS